MGEKIKCWDFFECEEKDCAVFKSKELHCWLVSGTHCRQEIQGKFLEKMEMCLKCEVFKENIDVASIEDTLRVLNKQVTEFRDMVEERDRELEGISMEMALGLSEVFVALKEISAGDPSVRIPEGSKLELIGKLKNVVNKTAEDIGEIVDLSHDFAIGLAEHFDVLHRVSEGDLAARVYGTSDVELLESLKKVTNQMVASVSREITERKRAEENLQHRADELRQSNEKLEQFGHVVSHELQEPLRTVISYLRMLQHVCREDGDGADEYIVYAVDGANRMSKLIDKLLADALVSFDDQGKEPSD
jgi:C4-dicarboxylate-specific signal transduction histidine kinase